MPDPLLIRGWTQWAYTYFCEHRGWSHLRAETVIVCANQKTGTVSFTTGSPTITGVGLSFAATDVGRQIRIGSIPIYTIVAVTPPSTATLHRPYSEATQTATVAIFDGYPVMPEDFHRFIAVLDPMNKWRLRFWITQDQLNRWDPGRMSSGSARLLASNQFSPVPGQAGQPRFEMYPFQTSAKTFPVFYFRKPGLLADTQEIVGPLARRAQEVLAEGALSRCAMWPGSSGQKNPYFNLQLAAVHKASFEEAIIQIDVKDDELYYEAAPLSEFQFADFPWDAAWLQQHEPFLIG